MLGPFVMYCASGITDAPGPNKIYPPPPPPTLTSLTEYSRLQGSMLRSAKKSGLTPDASAG